MKNTDKTCKINDIEFYTINFTNKQDINNIKQTSKLDNHPLIHIQIKNAVETWHLDKSSIVGQDSGYYNKDSLLKTGSVWIDPQATNIIPLPSELRQDKNTVKDIIFGFKKGELPANLKINIDKKRKSYSVTSDKELWLLNVYLNTKKDEIKYLPKKI